jgi:hypothetical protein
MTAKRTIKVPELEELVHPTRDWSEEEEDILMEYYNRIPSRKLLEYLNKTYDKNRSIDSLRKKAQNVKHERGL